MDLPSLASKFRRRCRARPRRHLLSLAAIAAMMAASGCGSDKAPTSSVPPSAPEAAFITIAAQPVTLTRELPGRTSPFRVAEVRARVNGIILKRLFIEGSEVKEGQVLFQIDPAPYRAALDSAQAALARAEANAVTAAAQAARYKDLIAANAVSKQDYDNATAVQSATAADVAASRAAVELAQINLGYTQVASPLTGHIGRSVVTEGAYVQQGTATLLATVQELDPLYVDLTQSSNELLRLKQALSSGRVQNVGAADEARVQLILEDGSVYPDEGKLEFSDVTVDPTTSSVLVRALFPNPQGELLPGMFVRARIAEASLPAAILVPQPAVTRDVRGDAVTWVVGADDKVEVRVLTTNRTIGGNWLVEDGLKVGDRVIVNNLQRIRPGMVIKPVPAEAPAPVAGSH